MYRHCWAAGCRRERSQVPRILFAPALRRGFFLACLSSCRGWPAVNRPAGMDELAAPKPGQRQEPDLLFCHIPTDEMNAPRRRFRDASGLVENVVGGARDRRIR
jgi:hypothetical protein